MQVPVDIHRKQHEQQHFSISSAVIVSPPEYIAHESVSQITLYHSSRCRAASDTQIDEEHYRLQLYWLMGVLEVEL